jgi:hypothetical protein
LATTPSYLTRCPRLYIRSEHNIVDPVSRRRNTDLCSLRPHTQNFLFRQVELQVGHPVNIGPFACIQSSVSPRYTRLYTITTHQVSTTYSSIGHHRTFSTSTRHDTFSTSVHQDETSQVWDVIVYPQWPLQSLHVELEVCIRSTFLLLSCPHHTKCLLLSVNGNLTVVYDGKICQTVFDTLAKYTVHSIGTPNAP